MPKGTEEYDLIVVGGGPAGLAAAINGASEGLKVLLIDSGPSLGGQAAQSSLIENYPGFSKGTSGKDFIGECVNQARKFGTKIECPLTAIGIRKEDDRRVIMAEDGSKYVAKAVILSAGLSYRRLAAENLGAFVGHGAYYGVPAMQRDAFSDKTITIVGGANSAGQAAMDVSRNPKAVVKLLIRKGIEHQMSKYLIDRIRARSNIEVVEGVQVKSVDGDRELEEVVITNIESDEDSAMPADFMFIFIGAQPKTLWLRGDVEMDDHNFILTGGQLVEKKLWTPKERIPLTFETSMPGVFSCGDVRASSTKRIASAVGEGSVALQLCHTYLGILNGA